jgi:hypothetical protein
VFLVRAVSTCAAGPSCQSNDPDRCFFIADSSGARMLFDPDAVDFLPPGDPRIASASRSQCFRMVLDDAGVALAGEQIAALRTQVFQLSGGEINLDVRVHEIPALDAELINFYTGLFLPPEALAAVALPELNQETDFTFAVSGRGDPTTGLVPRLEPCAGTNSLELGGLGASTYSWIGLGDACMRSNALLGVWMMQFYFGLRDVTAFPDLYQRDYPACGAGDGDPSRWFPYFEDCTTDPDAPTCGQGSCPDYQAFYAHVLAAHWPRGRAFNGNHCRDGRMNYGETAVDSGGVCAEIGR